MLATKPLMVLFSNDGASRPRLFYFVYIYIYTSDTPMFHALFSYHERLYIGSLLCFKALKSQWPAENEVIFRDVKP